MSLHVLLSNRNSPFARKVRLAIASLGLTDRVVEHDQKIGQVTYNQTVSSANPVGQIPALSIEGGEWLHDSGVILAYLDQRYGEGRLHRSAVVDPWVLHTLASLADAVINAAILMLRERGRPEGLHWQAFSDAQQGKIESALNALAKRAGIEQVVLEDNVAGIGLSVALDFVSLRGSLIGVDLDQWPTLRDALARKAADPGFIDTRPAIK